MGPYAGTFFGFRCVEFGLPRIKRADMSSAPPLSELLAHGDWVRALARTLVRDPNGADDLAQDAFVIALERPPQHAGNLRGWWARVLHNLHRERLRNHRNEPSHHNEHNSSPLEGAFPNAPATPHQPTFDTTPHAVVERAEAMQRVVQEVLDLAEPYRTTVLLRYFDDLPPSEIAQRQGVPLATVTSRLTRAHAQLREHLDARHGNDGRAWALALLPLIDARSTALPAASAATGILLMTTLTKTLIGLVALAIGLTLGWQLLQPEPAPQLPTATTASPDPADSTPATLREEATAASERQPIGATITQPVVDQTDPVVLGGTVFLPDGAPAADAFVVLGPLWPITKLEDGEEPRDDVQWVRTDAEGRFGFTDLPASTLLVTAGARGSAPSLTQKVPLDPTDPQTTLELQLRVGAHLSGEVLRPDGSLATNRDVRILQAPEEHEQTGHRLMRYIQTDEFGRFDIEHLRPGTWGLMSVPSNEEAEEFGIDVIGSMLQATIELADGQSEYVVMGAPSADAVHVTGVVSTKGEPIPNALLQWIAEGDDPMGSQVVGTTDAEGRYEVELSRPGAWWVRILGGGTDEDYYLDIPAVDEYTKDFTPPSGTVRGMVRDVDGNPLAGVSVSHLIVAGREYGSPLSLAVDRKLSEDDGSYELQGMGPGVYQIGAVGLKSGIARPIVVELGPDEVVENIDFVIRGGGALGGVASDASGLPLAGVPLWLLDSDGLLINPISQLRTNGQGRFRTPPLPPGTYSLIGQAGLRVAMLKAIDHRDEDQLDLALKMEPGSTLIVELAIDGELQRGQVRVHDLDGRVMTGLRDFNNPWTWQRYPFDSFHKHVGPLPSGTYVVSVEVPGKAPATRNVSVLNAETITLRFDL